MKRYFIPKILPLIIVLLLSQRFMSAGETYHQGMKVYISDSLINKTLRKLPEDSLKIDTNYIYKYTTKNILNFLEGIDTTIQFISWRLDESSFSLESMQSVDTSMHFPHLFIPEQKRFETFTSLGNIGAPRESDHFFSRQRNYDFIFSRFLDDYLTCDGQKYYYVRKPLTLISYTSGGGSRTKEQTIRLLHTQNVNKYFNVGLTYDNFGTKGIYKNQTTKSNRFAIFASYFKNKVSAQGTFSYSRIRNDENGGIESDYFIQDTTIDSELIPVNLSEASSEVRKKSFAGMVGYTVISRWVSELDSTGKKAFVKKPVFSLKAFFDANKQTRTYIDADTAFYTNYYLSRGASHDSAMILTYQSTILAEFEQLAKFPGLPGVRFWITNTNGRYYNFKPTDFLIGRSDDYISNTHIGAGMFSYSPYLSYNGSIRMYLNGYRASDKELLGQMVISPWKSEEYPYIKAKIELSDREPDVFIKNYFSNHFKWENNFEKEKWFMLGGSIGADKWRFEAGYNLVRINNYIYFDTIAVPQQASGVTITSAFVKKEFKLGHFYSTNRVLWQAYDNKDAINLPTFSIFSSISFEFDVVKKVLKARVGANVFFRTKFYADAYSPATGQFYNQKTKKIGDYPVVDAFVDLKWRRTVLFFKYEHVNQGIPNNEYFSALHYPLNQRIIKFGVSWIFYD